MRRRGDVVQRAFLEGVVRETHLDNPDEESMELLYVQRMLRKKPSDTLEVLQNAL